VNLNCEWSEKGGDVVLTLSANVPRDREEYGVEITGLEIRESENRTRSEI
jgi:hypothetical protein